MPTRFRTFETAVAASGIERPRATLALLFEVVGLVGMIVIGAAFTWLGHPTIAFFYWGYAGLLVLNVAIGIGFGKIGVARFNALALTLVMPFVLMYVFGGFTPVGVSAGAMSLMSPIAGMLLVKRERAVPLIGGSLVLIVAMVLLRSSAARMDPHLAPDLEAVFAAVHVGILILIVSGMSFIVHGRVEEANRRADALLLNVLPRAIAERLKERPETIAERHDEVTVLFADIVDFTTMSADADPEDVVGMLNGLFSDLDDLAARHGLEKIKTIGDAYMVAGGIPDPMPDHTEAVMAFATELLDMIDGRDGLDGTPLRMRVGIDTGPVVAGVIGRHKFIYDMWGDVVNTASRMESSGLANVVQVTDAVYRKLEGRYVFERRPPIEVKGKGTMTTYVLRDRRVHPSGS